MSSKTKSDATSRERFRMVRAVLPDTPRPPQFQPELWKKQFCSHQNDFSRFTNKCVMGKDQLQKLVFPESGIGEIVASRFLKYQIVVLEEERCSI